MNRPSPTTLKTHMRIASILTAAVAAAVLMLAVAAGPASAATASPGWSLDLQAQPSSPSPADNSGCASDLTEETNSCDSYVVTATNVGSIGTTSGSAVTLTDDLPAGVTIQRVSFFMSWLSSGVTDEGALGCTNTATTAQCSLSGLLLLVHHSVAPGEYLQMVVYVTVDPSASGTLSDQATVSGGGAAEQSASTQNPISAPVPFGIAGFSNRIAGVDGQPDTQAGGHPYELTTTIDMNSDLNTTAGGEQHPRQNTVEDPKDVVIDLPLGFMGSALSAPTCTQAQLGLNNCPADSIVGQIFTLPTGETQVRSPIANMAPEKGDVAEFGFLDLLGGEHVLKASVVPSAAGYVLQVTSPDIPQVPLTQIFATFYGNPSAQNGGGAGPAAMFTNPTDCSAGPLVTTVHIDSWQHPGTFNADGTPNLSDPAWKSATSTSPPVTGCNQLQFESSVSVQPDTTVADSPTGLHVDIKVPQTEDPNTLATPPLKDASVTLPPGFTVNPSSAAGLQACTPAQIALGSAAPPSCPQASQIGTVQLQTPLIAGTLQGEIYLASEFNNPFNSLIAGYIVVDDPTTGLVIKIPGNLTPNPVTGQITGVFDNNPQFPFSDLKLDFKGGPTGVLATPQSCGTFTTDATLSPWSAPDSGPANSLSDSSPITSGCVSGFAPSFTAGTQNAQAGAFSPFVLSMQRSDTDQNFSGLSVKLPEGMLAKLAGVTECTDAQIASILTAPGTGAAQAANPSCPANSQVGTVTTGAGVGPDPFFLSGKVYLTGPYKGAPFGLAIVVPALAGPFDLGTVVVRQQLQIDPETARATDVSDPFPTILDGIPLDIKRVDVDLNRPDFTVNPTSCDPMSVTGTATSTGGLSSNLSSRFQVGGCQDIGFSPKLKIALSGKGKTRSGDHPTLTATLTQKSGQANIHTAKVTLPLSMALDPNNSQHVCAYATAAAVHGGAVGCPTKTIVGTATADTPLLSQPLTGNVYLVQGLRCAKGSISAQGTCPDGKTAIHTLPSLLVPLRGQIALDLRAKSSVNGAGGLVTTFATIPDAPVSKFTLQITGGKKGLLVVTGRGLNICAKSQVGNADFGAQSGKTIAGNMTLSTPCGKRAKLKVLSKTTGVRVTPASAMTAAKTVTVRG